MEQKGEKKDVLYFINEILFFCFAFASFFGNVTKFKIAGHTFGPSFYISIFAFPLFLVSYIVSFRRKYNIDYFCQNILPLIFILLFSSLGMAYILYPSKNGLFGTNPFKVWAFNSAKYIYDLFGIVYCIFFLLTAKSEKISKFCTLFFWTWAFVGFVQIIVYKANNVVLNSIYDSFNFLGILQSTTTMARIMKNYGYMRIAVFGSEPASNCIVIFCFIVPVICYKFYKLKSSNISLFSKIRLYLAAAITLVFAILTRSSSIFAACIFFILTLFFIFIFFKKSNIKTKFVILAVGLIAFGIIFVLLASLSKTNGIFLKLFNTGDYSTQHRYSTIWNDVLIFSKSPLFGVGDGNQGYYYFENVVGTWMSNNVETQASLRGENGLLGGGAFVPSFLSGYGLLGIVAVTVTFKRYFTFVSNRNGFFSGIKKHLIIASMSTFGLLSVATANIHFNASAYLIIALPVIFCLNNNNTYKLSSPYYKINI